MDSRPSDIDVAELLRERSGLVRLVRGLVSDPDLRAEVEQRTVLHALTSSVPVRRLRGFLASAARGMLLNARREAARRSARERACAEMEAETSIDPARLAERAELQRHVLDAVLALPEAQRSVVLLRFHGDLDCSEIASRLGMAEPTVRSQLRRALSRLRERLDRDPAALGWRSLWLPTIGARETSGVAATVLAGGILMNGKMFVAAAVALLATAVGVWSELRVSSIDPVFAAADRSEPSRVVAPVAAAMRSEREDVATTAAQIPVGEMAIAPSRATLHGRILREGTLEPLAGVVIHCLGRGVGDVRSTVDVVRARGAGRNGHEVGRSLPDGSYRIEGLPLGEHLRFCFEIPGGLPSTREITLRETGESQVDFVLERSLVVRGIVIDAVTQQSIARASVRASLNRGDGPQPLLCDSDPNGRFEFTVPLSLAPDLVISATATGYVRGRIRPREDGSVELPLLPATRLEGIVIDEQGAPLPGATIRAGHIEIDRSRLPAEVHFTRDSDITSWTEGMPVDESGRFVIEGLPPWSKVMLDAGTPDASGSKTIETNEPSQVIPVTVTLAKKAGTAELRGVLSVNGKPMALPFSLVVDGRPIGNELRSSDDGTYHTAKLPAGLARLSVRAEGAMGNGVERTLRAGEIADLNLDVEVRTSWIAGRVRGVDGGAQARGFTLRTNHRDYRVGYQTAADGTFRVPTMLGVGEEAILRVITDTGYFDQRIEGGDEAIDVLLPERGVVRLRIVDRDSQAPVLNPSLCVLVGEGERAELTTSRVAALADGTLEVTLAVGMHTLEIDRTPAFYSPVRVVVEAKRDPGEWLVELPKARTGILRIEIETDAPTVLPRKSMGYYFRPKDSNQAFRAVPPCAYRVEQAPLIELELPLGIFEFAVNDWSTKELVTLATDISIAEGMKSVLRVRRE